MYFSLTVKHLVHCLLDSGSLRTANTSLISSLNSKVLQQLVQVLLVHLVGQGEAGAYLSLTVKHLVNW